jgi:uncharacterized protein (TIGR03435 family)
MPPEDPASGMMSRLMKAALVVSLAIGCPATKSQTLSSFEVASVKPMKLVGQGGGRLGMSLSGNRVTIIQNLKGLVLEAYEMDRYQVLGGPSWVDSRSDFFEIQARSESEPTRAQAHMMLQELLRERFQLEIHKETRETAIYALVVGKNGPKLKTTAEGVRFGVMGDGHGWTGTNVSMVQLAKELTGPAGHPVVDRTGLKESYDFRLEWAPFGRSSTDSDGQSIFTAVEQQLGLKLEPQRAPIEFLIIDSVQRPSEN